MVDGLSRDRICRSEPRHDPGVRAGQVMRVLFDQATPVPIRPFLAGQTVSTAGHEGWDRLENGDPS